MSQLKMMVSTTALVCPSLPDLAAVSYQVPEEVLDSRLMKKGDTEVAQLLIKWSNISRELATSEDKEDLAQQFPAAPAWGQAAAQARGGCYSLYNKHGNDRTQETTEAQHEILRAELGRVRGGRTKRVVA
jgi:hypothetical protein